MAVAVRRPPIGRMRIPVIYYIADTHFGDSKAMELSGRPFSCVEDMDATIIENWNNRVKPADHVYIVGDFALNGEKPVEWYLKQLPGQLHLIEGNHDGKWEPGCDLGRWFADVCQIANIKDRRRRVMLCHYPCLDYNYELFGGYLVFGHIHQITRAPYWHVLRGMERALNACVDVNGFKPVTLDEAIENNAAWRAEHVQETEAILRDGE